MLISLLIGAGFVVVGGAALPTPTYAAEVRVQTTQVLQQGSTGTCAQLPVTGFTPYIYNNELHSFEFFIPDTSYVALVGLVGETAIPFNYMTRRVDATGNLRIHVDVESAAIRGNLPLSVTMLSSKGPGSPVCLTVVTTSLASTAPAPAPAPAPTPTPRPNPTQQPRPTGTGTGSSTVQPPATSTTPTTTPATTTGGTVANTTVCSTTSGAAGLWLVLLALYALTTALAATGQIQKMYPRLGYAREWNAAAVVLPFLLLFAFWTFVPGCRTAPWTPALAILIAVAGLAAGYWYQQQGTGNVIVLPQGKTPQAPQPPQTPPAQQPKKN